MMTQNHLTLRASLRVQHDRDRLRALRAWGHADEGERPGHQASAAPLNPPGREDGCAVNQGGRLGTVGEELEHARPRAVVVDDLLTPTAFRRLQRYLALGDLWRDVAPGMLGARPEALSDCPLVRQIVEELRVGSPGVLGRYPRVSYWAFKCLLPDVGTGIHADCAAVTVNLWLTDDSANLDPSGGGLVLWDATPPSEWQTSDYNSLGEDHQALIRRHLESQAPFRLHIPYRANRFVLFQSTLFHASDRVRFADSFATRRMNLTFLFS
jgi:hypothetical protein